MKNGRLQEDPLLGRGDHQEIDLADRLPLRVRPALRDLHRQERPSTVDRRVVGRADHLLAGGVEPADREAGLQPLRPLADDAQVRVPPALEARGLDLLLVQIQPADIADLAVDDRDLAVAAVVDGVQVAELAVLQVGVDRHPGGGEVPPVALAQRAAGGVVEAAHLDAGLGALDQRLLHLEREAVLGPDVVVEVDVAPGRADVGQQARVFLAGVLEDLDLVAAGED